MGGKCARVFVKKAVIKRLTQSIETVPYLPAKKHQKKVTVIVWKERERERMNERSNERTDGRTDGRMDERTNEQTNKRINE